MQLQIPNAIGFVLGSSQLIIYAIYNNKSKKSTKGEGSGVTLVKIAVEMQANGGNDDEDNLKNKSLHKGRSLPQPIVNQLYTMPTKLMKTLSLRSQELNSVWDFGDEDLENGEKNIHP